MFSQGQQRLISYLGQEFGHRWLRVTPPKVKKGLRESLERLIDL